jgi:hypothetical protein
MCCNNWCRSVLPPIQFDFDDVWFVDSCGQEAEMKVPKKEEVTRDGENCKVRNLVIY